MFRTVQGPYRDGGDDAKKTGQNTTGRDRQSSSGLGQRSQGTAGLGGTPGPYTLGLSGYSETHVISATHAEGRGDGRTAGIVRGTADKV